MAAAAASLLYIAALLAPGAYAQQTIWGQCGGVGYSGESSCTSGSVCTTMNPYYAQCVPGTAPPQSGPTSTAKSGGSAPSGTSTTTASTPTGSGVELAGINISGFDFGCTTDGTCDTTEVYPPVKDYTSLDNNPDGIGQMQHFVNDDNLNIFRLPVGWQFLVNNNLGGDLDSTNLAKYDELVQGCLATGAYCIIDIHNYARWNGAIIGQGGPTNAQFASLWTQLATKYASESKIWFGTMNEPHDVDIDTWAESVQAAVTAIRGAGATSQYISLPGTDYQSAGSILSDGGSAALSKVTNPDGTTTNLIFDVHKYLDSDNSGQSTECVTDNVDAAFSPLADFLRQNSRQAILTETGGGNTQSCEQYLCQQLDFLNQNSDVYLGYVTWAAGSFDSTYALVETPTGSGSSWTDTALVKACIAR